MTPGFARWSDKGVNMIELAFIVCLIDSPDRCRDVGLTYSAENLTPMQCVIRAQPELAKWANEHPGWQVKRFTCRPAGQVAKT